MKRIVLILSLAILASSLFSQTNVETGQLYEQKIRTYTNMRNIGYPLAFVGATCLITGVILHNDDQTVIDLDNDMFLSSSGIITLVGIAFTVPGIIFIIMGSKKRKSYSEKLERLDLGVSLLSKQKGITLTYRF